MFLTLGEKLFSSFIDLIKVTSSAVQQDNKPLYNITYLHGKSDRRGGQAIRRAPAREDIPDSQRKCFPRPAKDETVSQTIKL